MATAAAAATPAMGKSASPIAQAATTTAHCEGRQITVQILEIVDTCSVELRILYSKDFNLLHRSTLFSYCLILPFFFF